MQAGGFPEPEIIHYNPKDFDFGKKKAFPFRDQVFLDFFLVLLWKSTTITVSRTDTA